MTLADAIIDAVGSKFDRGLFGTISRLAEEITEATCFVFTDDTKEAMGRLASSKPSSLVSALPLCRAPFKKCWFEWSGKRVESWNRLAKGGDIPLKFGVFIDCIDETYQRMGVVFSWQHDKKLLPPGMSHHACINIGALGYFVDWSGGKWKFVEKESRKRPREFLNKLSPGELEAENRLLDTMVYRVPPMLHELVEHLRSIGRQEVVDEIINKTRHDIVGEINYVIAALCLLNSKNCLDIEQADLKNINRARRRNGKKPLISYSTVKIALSKSDRVAAAELGLSEAQIRQHIVRGHFKIRKSGVYWWRPHIRGYAELGEVRRAGYEITA